MYKLILAVGWLSIAAACNNGSGKDVTSTSPNDSIAKASADTVPAVADTAVSGCYTWIYKRDTASFQIDVKGVNVTGPLSYNLFEKDRNEGSFQGSIEGDVLTGWYLFRSEGRMSVRQVAWKIDKGQLWQATGDMIMKGDSLLFKSTDNLRFDKTMAFIKHPCML